jgi:hypothetical protein
MIGLLGRMWDEIVSRQDGPLRPERRRTPGRRLTMSRRPVDPVFQGQSPDEQVFLLSTRSTHLLGDVP